MRWTENKKQAAKFTSDTVNCLFYFRIDFSQIKSGEGENRIKPNTTLHLGCLFSRLQYKTDQTQINNRNQKNYKPNQKCRKCFFKRSWRLLIDFWTPTRFGWLIIFGVAGICFLRTGKKIHFGERKIHEKGGGILFVWAQRYQNRLILKKCLGVQIIGQILIGKYRVSSLLFAFIACIPLYSPSC